MSQKLHYQFFAPCPKGLEELLASELLQLDVQNIRQTVAGVHFSADLEGGYRVCLWSRLASRVLLELKHFVCDSNESLYDAIYEINWQSVFNSNTTFAITASLKKAWSDHSAFVAMKIKDALVDKFRDSCGIRPSIDKQRPQIQFNFFCHKDKAQLYLDLCGNSLNKRGYRTSQGVAPLKENLAAALLLRARWDQFCQDDFDLIDPMCGSATLLVEGTMMAISQAPGLIRKRWAFKYWLGHQQPIWDALCQDAERKLIAGKKQFHGEIFGFDKDPLVLEAAEDNIRRAGLDEIITLKNLSIENNSYQINSRALVIANPPYGERLEQRQNALSIYAELGHWLKKQPENTEVALLVPDKDMQGATGLKFQKHYHFYNGQIPVDLSCTFIHPENNFESIFEDVITSIPKDAEDLVNRLKKNEKKLKSWLKKEQVSCYRIYDADLPEFNVAIDCYRDEFSELDYYHIQEYQAPAKIPNSVTRKRLEKVILALRFIKQIPMSQIVLKQRRKQKSKNQYQQKEVLSDAILEPFVIRENGHKFEINLTQYLDTGLFLDHRPVRKLIQQMSAGKSFLNLFAYTGSATVYAAAGGARTTTTVDLSKTYLQWARQNMQLNGFDGDEHQFVQEDCLQWLQKNHFKYDLIFLDPPTFSNSKKMQTHFDVQKDHEILIEFLMNSVTEGGQLIFSNNAQKFKLSKQLSEQFEIENITSKTLDPDFKRNAQIHHCYIIKHKKIDE